MRLAGQTPHHERTGYRSEQHGQKDFHRFPLIDSRFCHADGHSLEGKARNQARASVAYNPVIASRSV
jgi:hypothetical protein